MAARKSAPEALAAEERAAIREARKSDNRAKWRGVRSGAAETPVFEAETGQALDSFLQSLGGADKGLSVVVLQVAPQRHGELGGPSHILEQPYSPTLREADLKELARQSGAADPGTFELRVIKATEKGTALVRAFRRQWRWKVDPGSTSPSGALDQMRSVAGAMKETVGVVRELGGNSGLAPIDVPALINAVNRPAPSNLIADEFLRVAMTRLLAAPADPLATLATAAEFLERVKPPVVPPINPMDTLRGLSEVLQTVKTLAGGLAPEAPAPSAWIEVLRVVGAALGPLVAQFPTMWSMAQAQRAEEIELRKREALMGLVRANVPLAIAAHLSGVTLPPLAFGTAPPGRQEPITGSSSAASSGSSGGPLRQFFGAIVEGDDRVFPAIAETIVQLPNGIGLKILDALATDPNALATIRDLIEAQGARESFAELFLPGSDIFFGRFSEWLRAQMRGNNAGEGAP